MATLTLELTEAELKAVISRAEDSLCYHPERLVWLALDHYMRAYDPEDGNERFLDLRDIHDRFVSGEMPGWAEEESENAPSPFARL